MPFSKTILCLANSRKTGGHCIAGKEIVNGQLTDRWIRPVSDSDTGELSPKQILLRENKMLFPKLPKWLNNLFALFIKRHSSPKLLDIITIPLLKQKPHAYQSENYLIDTDRPWLKEPSELPILFSQWCDVVESLWINGYHSSHGHNDKIPQDMAESHIHSSLLLIKPDSVYLKVAREFGRDRVVRAEFAFKGQTYRLAVTDPYLESLYKSRPDGHYPVEGEIYLCITLGEPFNGYCYKLVAAILRTT